MSKIFGVSINLSFNIIAMIVPHITSHERKSLRFLVISIDKNSFSGHNISSEMHLSIHHSSSDSRLNDLHILRITVNIVVSKSW